MGGAWGPSDFGGGDFLIYLALFTLAPPSFVAMFGAAAHYAVKGGDRRVLVSLFRRWVAWCTGGWIVALVVALAFGD